MNEISDEIRKEYENTKTSFAKLGVKYKIPHKQIQKYAKKNEWIKFSDKVLDLTIVEAKELSDITPMQEHKVIENVKSVLGGYYREADEGLIMLYVDSYLAYLELKELVAVEGRIVVSEKSGASYTNPNVNQMQMQMNNIINVGKQLGINTVSRIRLGIDVENHEEQKKDSIFDMVAKGFNPITKGILKFKDKKNIPPSLLEDFEYEFKMWKEYHNMIEVLEIDIEGRLSSRELKRYGLVDYELGFDVQELSIAKECP
jgi:P27 family predicted phage terminase small subunit